jgi:hypothetical protein
VPKEQKADFTKKNREIRSAVSNIVSFIKESTTANVVYATRSKKLSLSEEQVREVNAIVTASIEEAFVKSATELERSLYKG